MDYRYYKKGEQVPYDLNIIICRGAEKLMQEKESQPEEIQNAVRKYKGAGLADFAKDDKLPLEFKAALWENYSLFIKPDDIKGYKEFYSQHYQQEPVKVLPYRYCKYYKGENNAPEGLSLFQQEYWYYERCFYKIATSGNLLWARNCVRDYQVLFTSFSFKDRNTEIPISLKAMFANIRYKGCYSFFSEETARDLDKVLRSYQKSKGAERE